MENDLVIHRGLDELGRPNCPISAKEWGDVVRRFPQLQQTRALTHRQTGEVTPIWCAEIDDLSVEIECRDGVIHICDASQFEEWLDPEVMNDPDEMLNPEQQLLQEIADALQAEVKPFEAVEVFCKTVRLEFEEQQDWTDLEGFCDFLAERLQQENAGTIVGEGMETGSPVGTPAFATALESMIEDNLGEQPISLKALMLYLETPAVDLSLDVLKSALPETGLIPSGTRVLLVDNLEKPDLKYVV